MPRTLEQVQPGIADGSAIRIDSLWRHHPIGGAGQQEEWDMHIAEPVAEVDAEQPAGQTGPANGRAREADRGTAST